jgi:hypothetical protein
MLSKSSRISRWKEIEYATRRRVHLLETQRHRGNYTEKNFNHG